MYIDGKEIKRSVVAQLHGLGMGCSVAGQGGWMDGWMDGLGHFRMGEGSFNLNHEATTVLQRDQSHNGIKAMAHCGQDTHTHIHEQGQGRA